MNNAPFSYEFMNVVNSTCNPSGLNVSNTETARFFRRYLYQKAMSVFKWTLPEKWSIDYFLYSLYVIGHIAIIETDKFGVICQNGCPYGFNVFYQPTNYQIANPLLKGLVNPVIGKECVVFKMTRDWRGIGDLVSFYADYMALTAQALGVNLINSRLSYIFAADNKAVAESMKKLFDKVCAGEPAVVADTKLYTQDGHLKAELLLQNVKQNFISRELVEIWTDLENKFMTAIGIPNANTVKKERMIVDEVNANNIETESLCDSWFDGWKKTIKEAKAMFDGLDELDVVWRYERGNKNAQNS